VNARLSTLNLILAMSLLVGCNNARLEPNLPVGTIDPQTLGEGPEQAPQGPVTPRNRLPQIGDDGVTCNPSQIRQGNTVKVLFLVDGSGSNFGQYGTSPSDPTKKWRINTLGRFIQTHIGNPNILYNFTLFKGTAAKSFINPQGEPGFSSDPATVEKGFHSIMKLNDGGNTPYKAALKKARNIIAADLQDPASANATYAVVIVSDGHPTDYKQVHDVIPDASAIKSLAPDRITLNSIYYSANKVPASAPQYLKTIANIGAGAFIVASTKKVLNLESSIRISGASCR